MNRLRHELQKSGLTEHEFACQIGVELSRLQYWLEFEAYRAVLHNVDEATEHLRKESNTQPL